MKNNFWNFVLGVAILITLGAGAWFLIEWFVTDVLPKLTPDLNPNVTAALLVGLLATATTLLVKFIEHKHNLQAQLRAEKTELYVGFRKQIDALTDTNSPLSEEQFTEHLKAIRAQIMFSAGPKMVNEFESFIEKMQYLKTGTVGDLANAGRAIGEFYLAMRRDLGLSNKGVSKETLGLGFILRNPKLLLGIEKTNPDLPLSELTKLEKNMERQQNRKQANSRKGKRTRTRPN